MSPELEEKLFTTYPTMFANVKQSPQVSPMAFGVECGDGWYEIIESACCEIAAREKHTGTNTFRWDQIKEKFGTLRLYSTGADDFIDGVIDLAVNLSAKTCETCGAPGERRGGGWIVTLCDNCYKPREVNNETGDS